MSMISSSPSDIAARRGVPLDVTVLSTPRNWASLLILVLVAGVFGALGPFASGLLGALALYVVVNGLYEWLARRIRPSVAAGLTVLAALLLIVAPLMWVAVMLMERAPTAVNAALHGPALTRMGDFQIGSVRVGSALASVSDAILSSLSAQLERLLGTATSVTINLVVSLSGLYYLLRASAGTWESVRVYVPFSARTADALRDRFVGVTKATVLGTGLSAVTQGVLIGLGFAITGLPEPLVWGTVAVFAAVVPAVGSTLVWLPGVLLLLHEQRYGAAVGLTVIASVIAGNVDNVIRPLVYRRVSAVHPMITLVGVRAGIRYLGVVGLLLGPLAIVYVFELLRFYREEYGSIS